jgi:hypothetical protein
LPQKFHLYLKDQSGRLAQWVQLLQKFLKFLVFQKILKFQTDLEVQLHQANQLPQKFHLYLKDQSGRLAQWVQLGRSIQLILFLLLFLEDQLIQYLL